MLSARFGGGSSRCYERNNCYLHTSPSSTTNLTHSDVHRRLHSAEHISGTNDLEAVISERWSTVQILLHLPAPVSSTTAAAMLRSLASRAVALRLVNTARTASTSHITTTRQPLSQLIATRSFATATPTVPVTAPTQRTIPGVPIPPEFVLTPEERNQHDWEQWDQAKMNIYVLSVFFGGILLVNYWSALTSPQISSPHSTQLPLHNHTHIHTHPSSSP